MKKDSKKAVSKQQRANALKPKKSRDRAATKKLFFDAVGEIIQESGIEGLRINRVAERAGRSKGLIYQYFNGMPGLLKAFLEENDDWLSYESRLDEVMKGHSLDNGRELASLVLKSHYLNFNSNKLLQQISLLELTGNCELLYELSNSRERIGDKLFSLSEELFRGSGVDIRMIEALMIGGINYMVLHSLSNGSTFCGRDIRTHEGKNSLRKTLQQITTWAFNEAENVKSNNSDK